MWSIFRKPDNLKSNESNVEEENNNQIFDDFVILEKNPIFKN